MKPETLKNIPWDPTCWVGGNRINIGVSIICMDDFDPRKRAALTANAMILRARRHAK